MPTYDYECRKCAHTFEAFHGMSDDPVEICPICGGKVKRLIGGGLGIIFKGSGFYVTDNKSAGKSAAPGSKKTENEGNGSAAGTEESKPAEKKADKEKVTVSTSE